MSKEAYTVTERGEGARIAGQRVKLGDELMLTVAQAEHELREGTIVKKGAKLAAAFTTDSPKLQALRHAAKGRAESAPPPAQSAAAQVDAAMADSGPVDAAAKPARKSAKE
jgi:hypothetical protein